LGVFGEIGLSSHSNNHSNQTDISLSNVAMFVRTDHSFFFSEIQSSESTNQVLNDENRNYATSFLQAPPIENDRRLPSMTKQ